jgi:hypothetical protein
LTSRVNEGIYISLIRIIMAKVGTHIEVVRKFYEKTGAGNGETLETNNEGKGYGVVYYDPGGGSRTGVILEDGVENGQTVTVVNVADAAETITFAAAGTSGVSNGATCVIDRYEALTFTWHEGTELWYPNQFTA